MFRSHPFRTLARWCSEYEKIRAFRKPAPYASDCVRAALTSFFNLPARFKMIGVDHRYTEPALYIHLATLAPVLARQKVGQVFIELHCGFAPLFQKASQMTGDAFVQSYWQHYAAAFEAKGKSVLAKMAAKHYDDKLALHEMIVGLHKAGIKAIPYDQRSKGDLVELCKAFDANDRACEEAYDVLAHRAFGGKAWIESARAFRLGGALAWGACKVRQMAQSLEDLRQEQHPAILNFDAMYAHVMSQEDENRDAILAQVHPAQPALILAGDHHIHMKSGLRDLLCMAEPSSLALSFRRDYFIGAFEAYPLQDTGRVDVPADYILSLNTGKTRRLNPAAPTL